MSRSMYRLATPNQKPWVWSIHRADGTDTFRLQYLTPSHQQCLGFIPSARLSCPCPLFPVKQHRRRLPCLAPDVLVLVRCNMETQDMTCDLLHAKPSREFVLYQLYPGFLPRKPCETPVDCPVCIRTGGFEGYSHSNPRGMVASWTTSAKLTQEAP